MISSWADYECAIVTENGALNQILLDLFKLVGVRRVVSLDRPFTDEGAQRLREADFVVAPLDANGLAVLHALRRNPVSPNPYIPVLVVGVDITAADVTSAIQFGAHDVLVLPVSIAQIRVRLDRAVMCGRPWVQSGSYFGPCRRRSLRTDWPIQRERRANAASEVQGRIAAEARASQAARA